MATPKKKHLIELMIEAGVNWPDGAEYAAQDRHNLKVNFYKNGKPDFQSSYPEWMADNCTFMSDDGFTLSSLCRNWHQTIVTREQYVEALAAANTSGKTNQAREREDIQPSQPAPEYCASVMRQMPSETIESLLSEIKAKREERDALVAKAAALALEIASVERQVNDKLKECGFAMHPVVVQSEPEQPVLTDWHDLQIGDIIECTAYNDKKDDPWPGGWATQNIGTQQVVSKINDSNGKISIKDSQDSGYAFKFIRRP